MSSINLSKENEICNFSSSSDSKSESDDSEEEDEASESDKLSSILDN